MPNDLPSRSAERIVLRLDRERNSFHKKALTFPRCCDSKVREVLHELKYCLLAVLIRGQEAGPEGEGWPS
jgi:hypothetical protein